MASSSDGVQDIGSGPGPSTSYQPTGPQVQGFKTRAMLEKHSEKLKLSRIMIRDLSNDSDLSRSYVGGWVIACHSSSLSQAEHIVTIFVRDESTTDEREDAKQLNIVISEEVVANIPKITFSSEFEVFVHNGIVVETQVEFSQDLGRGVHVSGSDARVWIVHKKANTEGFWKNKAPWFKHRKRKAEEITSKPPPCTSDDFELDSQLFSHPDDSIPTEDQDCYVTSSEPDSDDSEISWNPKVVKRGATGRKYDYKKLADLASGDKNINVFGVVKNCYEPIQSRGSDIYSNMVLVDESTPTTGIKCTSFARSRDKLPQVKRIGDVISLRKAYMSHHQSSLRLVNNQYSSCQRFSGRVGGSFKFSTDSISYIFTDGDKKRVKELRKWFQSEQRKHCRRLEETSRDVPFTLLCQVITVAQPKDKKCVFLTVWDGTQCPVFVHKTNLVKENQAVSKTSVRLHALSYGLQFQIVVHDEKQFKTALSLTPGDIVIVHGLELTIVDDTYFELQLMSSQLYMEAIEAIRPSDSVNNRLKETIKTVTLAQPSLTNVPHTDAPILPLNKLNEVTGVRCKARLRVKIIGVVNKTLEEMVQLCCEECHSLFPITASVEISPGGDSEIQCEQCGKTRLSCVYVITLMVTDLSGSVVKVIVAKKEAMKLLNEPEPTNFYKHQGPRYQLYQKLTELTGNNHPFKCNLTTHPRPWLDCCVVVLKNGDSNSYVMFDTFGSSDI